MLVATAAEAKERVAAILESILKWEDVKSFVESGFEEVGTRFLGEGL